jgi:hypothetical protein
MGQNNQNSNNIIKQYVKPRLPDKFLSAYEGLTNNAWSSWSQTGYNDDVSNTIHDLNFKGNDFDFDTVGTTLAIQSDDIGDDLGSTGINTIVLTGVGTDWNELTEIVNLDGTNTVYTTNEFLRLNYITPIAIGSNKTATGNITITGDGFTWGEIPANETNPHLGRYSVPVGKTLIFDSSGWSCDKTGEYFINAYIKPFGLPMYEAAKIVMYNSAGQLGGYPIIIQEKSDFLWRCQRISGSGNLYISIISSGILVDNNRIKNNL